MNKNSQLTEIRMLLPWYLNNTLDPAQRERVEAELKKNKTLRAEFDWLKSVQTQIQNEELVLPQHGLDKLMQRITAEQTAPSVRASAWLKPAFAIAASLLVVQTVVMSYLLTHRESALESLSGPVVSGAILQITFRPGVTEQQLRGLLIANQAEIISGPGALGIYRVRVSEERVQQVISALQKQSDIIESVRQQN
jgi:hypothetical protein